MADPHQRVATALVAGVDALHSGRPEDAVEPLRSVLADSDLAAAEDLGDVRARATSLLAQALLQTGDPDAAAPIVDQALRLLRQVGDPEGLRQVRALHAEIVAARQAKATQAHAATASARLAAVSVAEIEATVLDPVALADVFVRKANAETDAGRPQIAAPIARRALELARAHCDVRAVVLAHLSIARADPAGASQALRDALAAADSANEFTLVGAVARAAQLAGVELPVQRGPDMGPRG